MCISWYMMNMTALCVAVLEAFFCTLYATNTSVSSKWLFIASFIIIIFKIVNPVIPWNIEVKKLSHKYTYLLMTNECTITINIVRNKAEWKEEKSESWWVLFLDSGESSPHLYVKGLKKNCKMRRRKIGVDKKTVGEKKSESSLFLFS